jgi:hypothetical protein
MRLTLAVTGRYAMVAAPPLWWRHHRLEIF